VPENIKEASRIYRETHAEQLASSKAIYRLENKVLVAASRRAYAQKNAFV
jgi:hypothetical protein